MYLVLQQEIDKKYGLNMVITSLLGIVDYEEDCEELIEEAKGREDKESSYSYEIKEYESGMILGMCLSTSKGD